MEKMEKTDQKAPYTVVMVGINGKHYRSDCDSLEVAERLMNLERDLGWESWIEENDQE